MADDLGFQPIQQPTDDVGFKPIPKMPDTSGIQRMAQENLAANDNKETSEGGEPKPPQTPAERLNTAIGHPIQSLLNPDDNTPIPGNLRRAHTNMMSNGDSSNFGDTLNTILHAVAPIVASGIQHAEHPLDMLEQMKDAAVTGMKTAPAAIAGMFTGEPLEPPTPIASPGNPTGPELVKAATQGERTSLGAGVSALFWPVSALTAPIVNPLIQSAGGAAQKPGEPLTYRQTIPDVIGSIMDVVGMGALGAHEFIRKPVGKILGKPTESVAISDIDQVTAQVKSKAPAAEDFKNVAAYTGLPEKMLDTVYDTTDKTPENVLVDSQQNPSIAKDIANDEIPKAYEPFAEKRELPSEQLSIARSDNDKVFNVVDKEGDYVSGGFLSAEEARHYIEDEKFKADERKALEESAKEKTEEKPVQETSPQEPEKSLIVRIKDKLLGKDNQEIPALTSSAEDSLRPSFQTRDTDSPLAQEPSRQISDSNLPSGVFTTRDTSPSTKEGGVSISNSLGTKPVYHKILDIQQIKEAAKKAYPDLFKLLNKISENTGAKFDSVRIKSDAELNKKLSRGREPNQIADYLGGRITVDSLRQVDAVLDALKNGTNVTHVDDFLNDEGRDTGYRAVHVQIMGDNGLSAEIQIVPREIKDVGQEARRLYKETQEATDSGNTEKALEAKVALRSIYDKAWDRAKEFFKSEKGELNVQAIRKSLGDTITAVEKFAGKLSGGLFEKLADGYIRTFQPELMGDKALRADAYLAKFKAAGQEAINAYVKQSAEAKKAFDKLTPNQRLEWLYDHETGRWNEEENPEHARMQAMYDSLHKAEQDAGVGTTAYKENYLPHQWEKPEEVSKFFRSEAMIKKFGRDWFNKASEFRLVQEGIRAGFKLKTDNPESMLVSRQLASQNLISTMDLLKDLESSGIATRATGFSVDKRIAKTQDAITDLQTKYKKEFEKKNNPNQPALIENLPPAESKVMKLVEGRLEELKSRLDNLTKEKEANKLTPEQKADLKEGYRVIGPDNKVWNIHQEAVPVWKNAMEMKGLYENQGLAGNLYSPYMAMKAVYVRTKMLASMWHPSHEVVIDVSSDIASAVHHLVQGGKISDLIDKNMIPNVGLGKYTAKLQDNPQMQAWNTPPDARTPQQKADVQRMVEGGFVPTVPRQDAVSFKENFNKAISGVGLNNLRLIGTAFELPSLPMAPLMEHWIPGMKTESYFQRTELALKRDPTLAQDAGRRSEVFRQIAQDIERNYGEMNRETQFWNPIVRDTFNATTFSGGWKLAMLQNFRGLLEPAKIAYDFAKTGEFSREQITHQMLQSYIYTANMLMLGAGLNYLFTGAVGTIKDWINPQTGDKNPDGTAVRLRQPAFFNEPLMLLHDINEDGVVMGTGTFLYHQTQIPAIHDSLLSRDFVGRPYITDPTDLQQWKNMGWDSINPITLTNVERAEAKGSKTAETMGWLGFPIAGSWVNQSPFEQKVISAYDRLNPPTGNAYEAKLKSQMKGAIQNKDTKAQEDISAKMKAEGMTNEQIEHSKQPFKTPFAEFAWKKLSVQDQKQLIESASEEEKKKYKVKSGD